METGDQLKTVGEVIAEARQHSGLSLRELAKRISIHFTYLADIEKNRRPPTEKVIKGLSEQKELNLDFDFLMSQAGRLGELVEKYHKKHPSFGSLMRQIASKNISDSELEKVEQYINELIAERNNY